MGRRSVYASCVYELPVGRIRSREHSMKDALVQKAIRREECTFRNRFAFAALTAFGAVALGLHVQTASAQGIQTAAVHSGGAVDPQAATAAPASAPKRPSLAGRYFVD